MPNRICDVKNRISEIEETLSNYPRVKAGDPIQAVKWSLACEKRRLKLKLSKLMGFHITKKEELKIVQQSSGCVNCGSKDNLSIDHIIPIARGGLNCLDNIQVLCISCNSKKSKKCQTEY